MEHDKCGAGLSRVELGLSERPHHEDQHILSGRGSSLLAGANTPNSMLQPSPPCLPEAPPMTPGFEALFSPGSGTEQDLEFLTSLLSADDCSMLEPRGEDPTSLQHESAAPGLVGGTPATDTPESLNASSVAPMAGRQGQHAVPAPPASSHVAAVDTVGATPMSNFCGHQEESQQPQLKQQRLPLVPEQSRQRGPGYSTALPPHPWPLPPAPCVAPGSTEPSTSFVVQPQAPLPGAHQGDQQHTPPSFSAQHYQPAPLRAAPCAESAAHAFIPPARLQPPPIHQEMQHHQQPQCRNGHQGSSGDLSHNASGSNQGPSTNTQQPQRQQQHVNLQDRRQQQPQGSHSQQQHYAQCLQHLKQPYPQPQQPQQQHAQQQYEQGHVSSGGNTRGQSLALATVASHGNGGSQVASLQSLAAPLAYGALGGRFAAQQHHPHQLEQHHRQQLHTQQPCLPHPPMSRQAAPAQRTQSETFCAPYINGGSGTFGRAEDTPVTDSQHYAPLMRASEQLAGLSDRQGGRSATFGTVAYSPAQREYGGRAGGAAYANHASAQQQQHVDGWMTSSASRCEPVGIRLGTAPGSSGNDRGVAGHRLQAGGPERMAVSRRCQPDVGGQERSLVAGPQGVNSLGHDSISQYGAPVCGVVAGSRAMDDQHQQQLRRAQMPQMAPQQQQQLHAGVAQHQGGEVVHAMVGCRSSSPHGSSGAPAPASAGWQQRYPQQQEQEQQRGGCGVFEASALLASQGSGHKRPFSGDGAGQLPQQRQQLSQQQQQHAPYGRRNLDEGGCGLAAGRQGLHPGRGAGGQPQDVVLDGHLRGHDVPERSAPASYRQGVLAPTPAPPTEVRGYSQCPSAQAGPAGAGSSAEPPYNAAGAAAVAAAARHGAQLSERDCVPNKLSHRPQQQQPSHSKEPMMGSVRTRSQLASLPSDAEVMEQGHKRRRVSQRNEWPPADHHGGGGGSGAGTNGGGVVDSMHPGQGVPAYQLSAAPQGVHGAAEVPAVWRQPSLPPRPPAPGAFQPDPVFSRRGMDEPQLPQGQEHQQRHDTVMCSHGSGHLSASYCVQGRPEAVMARNASEPPYEYTGSCGAATAPRPKPAHPCVHGCGAAVRSVPPAALRGPDGHPMAFGIYGGTPARVQQQHVYEQSAAAPPRIQHQQLPQRQPEVSQEQTRQRQEQQPQQQQPPQLRQQEQLRQQRHHQQILRQQQELRRQRQLRQQQRLQQQEQRQEQQEPVHTQQQQQMRLQSGTSFVPPRTGGERPPATLPQHLAQQRPSHPAPCGVSVALRPQPVLQAPLGSPPRRGAAVEQALPPQKQRQAVASPLRGLPAQRRISLAPDAPMQLLREAATPEVALGLGTLNDDELLACMRQ